MTDMLVLNVFKLPNGYKIRSTPDLSVWEICNDCGNRLIFYSKSINTFIHNEYDGLNRLTHQYDNENRTCSWVYASDTDFVGKVTCNF
jgi:hypothetical protein